MKLAVIGSRDFERLTLVWEYVAAQPVGTTIITGGARGVDTTAEKAAEAVGLKVTIYPADWNALGRSAGHVRNATILAECDSLVAFWDGKSPGTKSMITKAKKAGKLLKVFLSNIPTQTDLFQG